MSSSSAFGFRASSVNTMQLLASAKERPVLTSQICAMPHLSWASAKTRETTWQFENSGVLWAILHNLEMCLATAHAIKMRGKSPKCSCKIVREALLWNAIRAQSFFPCSVYTIYDWFSFLCCCRSCMQPKLTVQPLTPERTERTTTSTLRHFTNDISAGRSVHHDLVTNVTVLQWIWY